MSDPVLTIGFAAIGFILPYALWEVYDAHKYRHHPNESVTREVKTWGIVILAWIVAIGLATQF